MLKWLAERFETREPVDVETVLASERAHIEPEQARAFDASHRTYLDQHYRVFVEQQYPEYVRDRYTYMDPNGYPNRARPCYGLALSGGGIRSASFAIGVIQALRNRHLAGNKPPLFERLTYLSTVSGGGYAGSALTWYQKLYQCFPFGNIDTFAGSLHTGTGENDENSEPKVDERPDSRYENSILSYIRQHGKYLTPSYLGPASLVGNVLLSVIHSVVAYTLMFSLAFLLFALVANTGVLDPLLNLPLLDSLSIKAYMAKVPEGLVSLRGHEDFSPHRLAFSVFFLTISLLIVATFLLIVLFYGLGSFATARFASAYCLRVRVQRALGLLLQGLAVALFFAAIPPAAHLVFGTGLGTGDPGLWSSIISGLAGILLSIRQFRLNTETGGTGSGLPKQLIRVLTLVAVIVFIFFIFLFSYIIAEGIHEHASPAWMLLFVVLAFVIPLIVNINQVAPHKMYRDRLMETFLKPPGVKPTDPLGERGKAANQSTLVDIAESRVWSPYHLINCNVILNNGINPRYRGRLGDSFLLSPLYCGSRATGYSSTDHFDNGHLTLATAMSISGAAENPHSGVAGAGGVTSPLLSFLATFLGLRLGYWTFNPRHPLCSLQHLIRPNYLLPGFRSLFNYGHSERNLMIELSDGGHFDNTGLYELVRRRTPVIILSDGSADPDATFDDFGNAVERIRVDFGVSIRFPHEEFDMSGVQPGSQATKSDNSARLYDEKYQLAERGYAIGDILYPDVGEQKAFAGRFVYIKSALTRRLPGDLYAYKLANPSYPNQPTSDQFFDERQFEAYRELGYQLTRQLLDNEKAMDLLP
ncbi:MAG: patatin-like phospholipase family protein [Oceanospirillaceae bacterium]|nr:patatin-like phospholipase family protein [Oceanospirillaceae bacterium]